MHYASIENISKSFGIRTLFKNISFYVEEGDKIAFVARNGSGKSTLLKIIAGLDTPDSGTIWVHKDIKVIMLQQDTPFEENKSIFERLIRFKQWKLLKPFFDKQSSGGGGSHGAKSLFRYFFNF